MGEKTRRFAGGYISLKTGSEGPRHDPYSYEECTITKKNGDEAVLHIGLGEWLTINGERYKPYMKPGEEKSIICKFEEICGISLQTFERTIHRHTPCCNNPQPRDVGGYPGEHITICEACGKAIDYSFDINAVI